MNYRAIASLFLLLPLLFGNASATTGAQVNPDVQPVVTSGVYDYNENVPRYNSDGATPRTDFTMHGTAWVPETRFQFSLWKPWGWGTEVKAKGAGYRWVHIPIPFTTYLADVAQKVKFVEFCAQSTNGAATKPVTLHARTTSALVGNVAIAWAANNNKQCARLNFTPSTWYEDIGVSVRLYFANATDRITLYKAWLQTEQ